MESFQQIIVNFFESKIFIFLISIAFGIFGYWFYLYIKELKNSYQIKNTT